MKIALLIADGSLEGPEHFSERDLSLARKLGAILEVQYSHPLEERYMANTCARCGNFIGSNFIHDYLPDTETTKGHQTGHICLQCAKHYD